MLQFKEFHSKLCILCARVDCDNGKKNDAQHSAKLRAATLIFKI